MTAYASWSVVYGEQPSAAKWNILGTNDAHFYAFLGDNLAWQDWTPSWTNFTPGSATITAKYIRIGNTVHYRLTVVLSGSTMGSSPTFSLPVTSVSVPSTNTPIGTVTILDSGTAIFSGVVLWASTTTGEPRVNGAAGSYTNPASLTSAVPMTWTNNDQLNITGTYEAA